MSEAGLFGCRRPREEKACTTLRSRTERFPPVSDLPVKRNFTPEASGVKLRFTGRSDTGGIRSVRERRVVQAFSSRGLLHPNKPASDITLASTSPRAFSG